jgi:hypothetical protein
VSQSAVLTAVTDAAVATAANIAKMMTAPPTARNAERMTCMATPSRMEISPAPLGRRPRSLDLGGSTGRCLRCPREAEHREIPLARREDCPPRERLSGATSWKVILSRDWESIGGSACTEASGEVDGGRAALALSTPEAMR